MASLAILKVTKASKAVNNAMAAVIITDAVSMIVVIRYFQDNFLLTTAISSSHDSTSFWRFNKPTLGAMSMATGIRLLQESPSPRRGEKGKINPDRFSVTRFPRVPRRAAMRPRRSTRGYIPQPRWGLNVAACQPDISRFITDRANQSHASARSLSRASISDKHFNVVRHSLLDEAT